MCFGSWMAVPQGRHERRQRVIDPKRARVPVDKGRAEAHGHQPGVEDEKRINVRRPTPDWY